MIDQYITKFRKIFYAGVIFFLSFTLPIAGQVRAPQITPLSPNSASLFKYAELPVNMYTGIPSISIPLYEIKSGGISVPVSLSYHAGGFRLEDQASWTGLGWTVQAGGQVTRNIKGFADEKYDGFFNHSVSYLNASQCSVDLFDSIIKKYVDVQPDEFSYSMPGKSGRFIYQQGASQPTTIPYDPVKINKTSTVADLSKFEIVDEGGTIFRFGNYKYQNSRIVEYTYGGSGAYTEESNPMPNSWMLTEIESADTAKKIRFNYASGTSNVQKLSRQYRIDVIDDPGGNDVNCQSPTPSISNAIQADLTYSIGTQYLSEIIFENGKVQFVQSSTYRTDVLPNQKSLEYIKIYNLNGTRSTLIRTIKFFYSYFKKNYNGVLQDWKLKRDQVQVMGADGITQEEYSFQYHTNNFSGDSYYPNDFNAQDYWGYYNGKTGNTNLIPTQTISYIDYPTINISIGGADRSTDTTYLREGVLKRITYPTGGFSEFDYEAHQYDNAGNTTYAGGLRVKKITSQTSSSATPIIKTYKYGQNASGKGFQNFLNYLGYFTSSTYHSLSAICWYRHTTYNSTSSMQIDGNESTPVLYPYITEYFGDPTTNNGKIEYVYDDGTPQADGVYLAYYPDNSNIYRQTNHWKRGNLTKKTVYNASNAKISETINTYQELKSLDQNIGLLLQERVIRDMFPLPLYCYFNVKPNLTLPVYGYIHYPLKTGVLKPLKTIEKQYDQNDVNKLVTMETNYSFETSYTQPVEVEKIVTQTSGNIQERISNYTKFPFQYSFTGTPSGAEALGIKYLQDKNIIGLPVEQYTVKKIFNGGSLVDSKVISGVITTYKPDKPYQDKLWQLEISTPLAVSSFGNGSSLSGNAFIKNSAYQSALSFDSYDNKGNVLTYHKENDIQKVYVWGYNGTYPVAEIIGASYSSVIGVLNQAILDNPSDDAALRTELNKIRINFPSAQAITYTYKPLTGVTSLTDINGRTTFYFYDAYNRLVFIRDKDNNIIKKFCYNYYGQPEVCSIYGNAVKNGVYTKNNCTSGMTGSQVTYTVPANTYYASTQTDADAIAQNDVNGNGQAYANANGTCTAPMITINGYNYQSSSFNVRFDNLSTSTSYNFYLPANQYSTITLGQVPAGSYNVVFYPAGMPVSSTFGINGYSYYGTGATFYNVSISSTSTAAIY
jgi:hypothetical protein